MANIIQKIVDEAAKRGHEVTIRNIAYALMRVRFDDKLTAYTVIKGAAPEKDSDVDAYDSMEAVQYLIRYFKKDTEGKSQTTLSQMDVITALRKTEQTTNNEDDSMTFEENRAGIEQQLREILELKKQCQKDGLPSDAKTMALLLKTEADLRVKLNDKFGASEKSNEQYVVVNTKFNHICEWTRHECWLQTREYAMQHWHLVPDPELQG